MSKSLWILFFILLLPQLLSAVPVTYCPTRRTSVEDLATINEKNCEAERDSPQCQELYKNIIASGDDLAGKILVCDKTPREVASVMYIGCLAGGWDGTGGALVDTADAVKNAYMRESQRLKACDQNAAQKANIYKLYNDSVPELLKLTLPSPEKLAHTSCAQLEQDLGRAKLNKDKDVSDREDYKEFIKNPNLSAAEAEYFAWRKKLSFAYSPSQSVLDLAKSALEGVGVRSSCYSVLELTRLGCEIGFQMALGVTGPKAVSKAMAALRSLKDSKAATEVAGAAVDSTTAIKSVQAQKNLGEATQASTQAEVPAPTSTGPSNLQDRVKALKAMSRDERIAKAKAELGGLDESQRIAKLETEISLPTDPEEKARRLQGLKDAHPEGAAEGGSYDQYSQGALKRKKRILLASGWTDEEADYLIMRGYAGSSTPSVSYTSVNLSVLKSKGDVEKVKFYLGQRTPQADRIAAEYLNGASGKDAAGVSQNPDARALFNSYASQTEAELQQKFPIQDKVGNKRFRELKRKIEDAAIHLNDPKKPFENLRERDRFLDAERAIGRTQTDFETVAKAYVRAGKPEDAQRVLRMSPLYENLPNEFMRQEYLERMAKELTAKGS